MSRVSSLSERVGALVHESALADPVQFSLHKAIIAARLSASCVAFALAPVYMTTHGVPELWAILCFAWLLAPLGSVALLSRSGRLVSAQAIAAFSFLGYAATQGLAGGPLAGGSFAWLVLASMEAAFSLDRRLATIVGALSVATAACIVLFGGRFAFPLTLELRVELLVLTVLPAAYAAHLASWSLELLKQREQLEKAGAARLFGLSEALGDLLLHFERSGAVLSVDRDCEALFKFSARCLLGRGFFERVHVGDRPAFLTAVADASDKERTVAATLRLRTSAPPASGSGYEEPSFAWVELRLRRIGSPRSAASLQIVGIVRDVTALKQHEMDLEQARRDAEEASAWKDRFLANISHELRTPLNGIIGFSEILSTDGLMPSDPAKRVEYARIINASGHHLLSVVNSILDMSKIEAGRFDIVSEAFEVAPLIESCCDIVRLKAAEGRVDILRRYSDKLPELVADKRACKQILINLLSNALKFTAPGGSVTVGARVEGNFIAFFVSDTGIGINDEDLTRVGDAFFQARSSLDRPYEGTGLGLSVVRGLVGLHGGTISLESCAGHGTNVTVRMPRDGRRSPPTSAIAKIDVIRRRAPSMSDDKTTVKKIA